MTSLGTLLSRVLGLLRDMATASLLGLSAGGVLDAFVVAFRIPNLFRRLFGEGALSASYLPVFTLRHEQDPAGAWRLASAVLGVATFVLGGIVLIGELGCAVVWFSTDDPRLRLLVGLTAVMLPYVVFVCLSAQLAATLQALGHFSLAALAPAIVNVVWLGAAWGVAPLLDPDKAAQAYALAVAILLSGPLQLWPLVVAVGRAGGTLRAPWTGTRLDLGRIARGAVPAIFGLAVAQINGFVDGMQAWVMTAGATSLVAASWQVLRPGAAAAIYFGERMYQFPLGMLGLALSMSIFPLLSRHAARGERRQLAHDLAMGLRLTFFLGVPASLGLVIVAPALTRLLFEHGEFDAADSARTAAVIAAYSAGVWAFCAAPLLIRGFYALGDHRSPVSIGLISILVNLLLNLILVWRWAEPGLAAGTALAAVVQIGGLLLLFDRRHEPLPWGALGASLLRTGLATALMGLAAMTLSAALPDDAALLSRLWRVLLPVCAGSAVFVLVAIGLRMPELRLLLSHVSSSSPGGK